MRPYPKSSALRGECHLKRKVRNDRALFPDIPDCLPSVGTNRAPITLSKESKKLKDHSIEQSEHVKCYEIRLTIQMIVLGKSSPSTGVPSQQDCSKAVSYPGSEVGWHAQDLQDRQSRFPHDRLEMLSRSRF